MPTNGATRPSSSYLRPHVKRTPFHGECELARIILDKMSPGLTCKIEAIGATRHPRHDDLKRRLRSCIEDCGELPDGYCYSLRSNEITLVEVAEWIMMERLCCPFLTFQLEVAGETFRLPMCGPEHARAILREVFPIREFFNG
jgi:hypothetical protein